MLEAIEQGGAAWPHGAAWEQRMRRWAARCARLIVLSDNQVHRAERLLGIDGERCVQVSNGFDPEVFHPPPGRPRGALAPPPRRRAPGLAAGRGGGQRRLRRRRPGGVRDGGPGAALRRALHRRQARRAADRGLRARPPGVRAPRAAGARRRLSRASGRASTRPRRSTRTGAEDVYLAGWHGHDELPGFLNASDVVVLPSVREQFGQVLVEGMACGLPAIAVDAHGPGEIVERRRDGLAGRAR